MRTLLLTLAVSLGTASAGTILIGNDTSGPETVYTTGGAFVTSFGQSGATGAAINAAGDIWTVAPNFGANNIVEYDPAFNQLNSFVATIGGNWIEDMSHGSGNTLWVGTFEGSVYAINDQTGAVISSFTVANSSFTGVAFDGTNLWVSGGLTTDALYKYSTSGTLLQTISLSNLCMGVGYDVSDGTLWCGGHPDVFHYTTSGALLGSFTTISGAFHDGIETPNLTANSTTVPEPTTISLLGAGLIGLAWAARRKR